MTEEQYQQARRVFWHWTKIELDALDIDEVRELLVVLPLLMLALHYKYQTGRIYGEVRP